MKKVVLAIAIVAVAALAYWGFSVYLVSKLDGRGTLPHSQNLQLYSSEDGISFKYPSTYVLSSHTQGNAEYQWDELVLLPGGAVVPQGGEAPPGITMSVFDVPSLISVAQWVKGDARSNYKLSGSALASTTVGGEDALYYTHSGLYEADAVAVRHGTKIFLFEGQWSDAQSPLRQDFANLLDTVQFTQ